MNEALRSREACLRQLESWVAAGWLRELDAVFPAFLAREVPEADPLLLMAAALASHQLGRGHVCLDLAGLVRDPAETLAIPPEEATPPPVPTIEPAALLRGVGLADWQGALTHASLVGGAQGTSPLVLEGTRLYLRRFWEHEQSVRAGIQQRLARTEAWSDDALERARAVIEELFRSDQEVPPPNWQKLACAVALRSHFAIVTGGPGTGKTTTVVRLLALLQHLALSASDGSARRLRIRLAAPTGKAAARLNASISGAIDKLHLGRLEGGEAVRQAIPREVSTVHRLLGSFGGTRRFRHDATNPLPLDVLVLDEASMVDLETMAAVIAALPARARLVLLGDKDQLASVEAGNVLGELCSRADGGHYLPRTRDRLEALSGERIPADFVDARGEALDQGVVKLRHSFRFGAASGIGQLAQAVNAGDASRAHEILHAGHGDLAWMELDPRDAALRRLVLEGHRPYLEWVARRPPPDAPRELFDTWARSVLQAYAGFQLLCAVRRGPHGVEGLNERIAALLHAEKLTPAASGWYAGRPVMVTRNDYALGLMNGDVGIALPLPVPEDPQRFLVRVAFEGSDGEIRWVLPSRLPAVETVFAMTVHKSQGSEFGHAALLLPQEASRVLTRELVYTGITRARDRFTLALPAGARPVLDLALQRRTRQGGVAPQVAPAGGVRP
ncbi:exodeoxyribonuclease V subunit alpha [Ramlibacter monticola]|uniref:RecBCD enzyme subunit RecD n=1 Tax=Ramlibacter monticola TaxID=1926872 RepID=A0A936Z418_9BURK|nr:exodeoxyribonuclease V subunit alpha [Ramlibacter monticola]MBL0393251.1 exodeoxyribonuclease V subunit alpha [Ramlibacter monticola]